MTPLAGRGVVGGPMPSMSASLAMTAMSRLVKFILRTISYAPGCDSGKPSDLPLGTRQASYEVDTVFPPRPVQSVWKRSPRGRSTRS